MVYHWRYVVCSGDFEIFESKDPSTVVARVDDVKEIWPTIERLKYNEQNKQMLEALRKRGGQYAGSELTEM